MTQHPKQNTIMQQRVCYNKYYYYTRTAKDSKDYLEFLMSATHIIKL